MVGTPHRGITMEKKTWLIIADATVVSIYALYKAKILQHATESDLELVAKYNHAEGRMHERDFTADEQGHFQSGTFVGVTNHKDVAMQQFAHDVAHKVEQGRQENLFHELILVAPPTFMGYLNKNLSTDAKRLVTKEIEKEYTNITPKEMLKLLMTHL